MFDSKPIESLYVHVPFCARKCTYCAFYSESQNGEVVNRYVEALIRELELVADYRSTVFNALSDVESSLGQVSNEV